MDAGHEIDDHWLYCLVLFGCSILGNELWQDKLMDLVEDFENEKKKAALWVESPLKDSRKGSQSKSPCSSIACQGGQRFHLKSQQQQQ
jgi:hypothetical protein